MPTGRDDLIWIQDAEKEYDRTRKWLDGQVEAGRLSYATIAGDKRHYLLRSELDALLRPQVNRNPTVADRGSKPA
jgi:hypothetical protein